MHETPATVGFEEGLDVHSLTRACEKVVPMFWTCNTQVTVEQTMSRYSHVAVQEFVYNEIFFFLVIMIA